MFWLVVTASLMVMLYLQEDPYQPFDPFSLWVGLALIPALILYFVGLVFGAFAMSAVREFPLSRPASWKAVWLLGAIVWAALVAVLAMVVRSPMNPLYTFARPVAVAIVLLVMLLPPILVYSAGAAIERFRGSTQER